MGEQKKKRKTRYRHAGGKPLIEVRVKSTSQLFDARDPAPFRERDLDDDFLEYIMSSSREFSFSTSLKIVIYIEEEEKKSSLSRESICDAIHSFLTYRIEIQRGDIKSFIRRSQIFLLIGLFILILCLSLSQQIIVPHPPGAMGVIREGIVIFGWVSIWKPIELILFDWYPLYEKLRYFKKLLETEIDVRFAMNPNNSNIHWTAG